MTIEVTCSHCHKMLRADDSREGQTARCPHCGNTLVVTRGAPVATSAAATGGGIGAAADGRPMKTCPMCGEDILAVAMKCRYCGESFGTPPAIVGQPGPGAVGLWRKGRLLVMHKHAQLPDICVKSNQPAHGRTLKRKMSWHHPALYLLIFAGLLVYIIVAIVLQKSATIYIGLTQEWISRRRRRILISWTGVIVGLAAMIYGISQVDRNPQMGYLIAGGIIGWIVAAIYGAVSARLVIPTRITDEYVWLKGVHRDYLAALPEWPEPV